MKKSFEIPWIHPLNLCILNKYQKEKSILKIMSEGSTLREKAPDVTKSKGNVQKNIVGINDPKYHLLKSDSTIFWFLKGNVRLCCN